MCISNTESVAIKDYYGSYQHIIDLAESEANVIALEKCSCTPAEFLPDENQWEPGHACQRCIDLSGIDYQIYVTECVEAGHDGSEPNELCYE